MSTLHDPLLTAVMMKAFCEVLWATVATVASLLWAVKKALEEFSEAVTVAVAPTLNVTLVGVT